MLTKVGIKNLALPSIGIMHNTAKRLIFEPWSVSALDTKIMEEGLIAWGKISNLSPMDTWEVKRIVNALIANENGHFRQSREIHKEHKVDWRKLYDKGLPYIPNPNRKF